MIVINVKRSHSKEGRVSRSFVLSLIAFTVLASVATAAPRTVLFEHFTASW